jgi:hypothetical protein
MRASSPTPRSVSGRKASSRSRFMSSRRSGRVISARSTCSPATSP